MVVETTGNTMSLHSKGLNLPKYNTVTKSLSQEVHFTDSLLMMESVLFLTFSFMDVWKLENQFAVFLITVITCILVFVGASYQCLNFIFPSGIIKILPKLI